MTARLLSRVTAATALALSLAAAPAHAAPPGWHGPDPTERSVTAERGPYAVTRTTLSGVGFNGAAVYHPTTTREGRFGAVVLVGGFLNGQAIMEPYGPRLASQGFVVVVLEPDTIFDFPEPRAAQMLAALDHLTARSSVRDRVDPGRLAVMGYSMGGGGALRAAERRPSLKASIGIAPWQTDTTWPANRTPQLLIGDDNDFVAPVAAMAEPIYESLPASTERALAVLTDMGHLTPLVQDDRIFELSISWLKRFVDGDTRYERFLCPGPRTGTGKVTTYRSSCPII